MNLEQLRDDLSQQIRDAGYSGFIMITFPKPTEDGNGIHISSASARVYDHPDGKLLLDEERNLRVKPEFTEDEDNITNSMLLSVAKKLAYESDFALSKIDEDFLITNAEKIINSDGF
jgi:hypothetical protein